MSTKSNATSSRITPSEMPSRAGLIAWTERAVRAGCLSAFMAATSAEQMMAVVLAAEGQR